jgi:hypothetical protein
MNLYLYESYLLSSPPTKITIFYKYCFTAEDGRRKREEGRVFAAALEILHILSFLQFFTTI